MRSAQRRKAFEPVELPFGAVSLDGKGFSIPASDDGYPQPRSSFLGRAYARPPSTDRECVRTPFSGTTGKFL